MFEGDSADALARKFPLHASLVLRHSHIIILYNKIVDTVLSNFDIFLLLSMVVHTLPPSYMVGDDSKAHQIQF
jgi:hypothetical protein